MTNRRFEMYHYRQILVRMRLGDSDREIARSKTMGRKKVAQVREHAFPFREQIRARPFGNEGVNDAANIGEFADEIPREVNDMGIDVAVNAAAAGCFFQSPVERKFRIRQPVLCIARAEMINLSERAFSHHPLRQSDRRNAPVIVADHVNRF